MQLTVHDLSALLKISEATIYRWIKQNEIPAYKIHDQYKFNKSEIFEWACSKKIDLPYDMFESETDNFELPSLETALKNGGIFYNIPGDNKEQVFKSLLEKVNLPEDIDKDFLFKILIARENMASTGVGDGIAFPHARNPIIINASEPKIALGFLEKPIDFNAIDRRPVHILFLLISKTVRIHLHLISRLAFCLKEPEFKKIILMHGMENQIFNELSSIEKKIASNMEKNS